MNLDAYMIRKIAPRLFFAVIGINLSIYLCIGAVDIATVVGHGIGQLIRGPFDASGVLDAQVDVGGGNIAGGALLVLGLLAIPAFKGGALATIFFLLLPVFVLILTVLMTIALRQALVVLLTLISPVAIVLAVLPGTEKYFKQWWDLFVKTLVVYPLISALFAISDVLTAINYNNSNGTSNDLAAVHVINGLLFAFMPLVLIPFAFRFAGGALGAFSNATRQAQSMANRVSSSRLQKNYGQGFQDIKAGGLFSNVDRDENGKGRGLRHRLNRGASRVANLDKMRITRPRHSLNDAMENSIMQRAKGLGESAEAAALNGFDDEHWANTHSDGSLGDIKKKLVEKAPERFDPEYLSDADKKAGKVISASEKAERLHNLDVSANRVADLNKVHGAEAGRAFSAMTLPSISTSFEEQFYKYQSDGQGGVKRDADNNPLLSDEIWKKGDDASLKSERVAKSSHDQMQEMIYKVSGGKVGLGNYLLAQSIQGAKQAGRYDLAASASANLVYQEVLRSGDTAAIQQARDDYDAKLLDRLTPGQATQGHVRGTKEAVGALQRRLDKVGGELRDMAPDAPGFADKRKEMIGLLARAASWQEAAPSASKEAADIIQKNLMSHKVPGARFGNEDEATTEELLRYTRDSPEMAEWRREWGTKEEGAQAEVAGQQERLAKQAEEVAKKAAEGQK